MLTVKTGPGGTEVLARRDALCGAPKGKTRTSPETRQDAHRLRQAVEHAKRVLERDESSPCDGQLQAALTNRQQFWLDTCREVLEMKAASPQTLDLHRRHGCRFCVPTVRQVQHILDALDSAMPGWDRDHPDLVFHTLELNFPELLRVRMHRRM